VFRIAADQLREFASKLLAAGGTTAQEASIVGDSLVGANLRGHDSHGVMRIPYYLGQLAKQEIKSDVELTFLRETPSVVAADAQWGFGQVQARRLIERLIDKARGGGVAIGTLIHSAHIGRLGEYCELAAEAEMVSMVMANTHGAARRVAPVGGRAPRLGTNPLAIGAPHGEKPLILDIGTSATAEGKVRVKRIAKQTCPEGWLLDSEGRPTNDPEKLYADPPGTILPMGGDQAYKGFGLALMIEILTGALSGGVCIRETPINQVGNCVWMLVIDPDHVGGADHFRNEVAGLDKFVRSCPRIDDAQEIILPGDPERQMLARRLAEGIPFDEGNWSQLAQLAERLKVAVPEAAPDEL